jgi:transcriptional regulator
MAHPFEKMFEAGIKKSTEFDNGVLAEALKLREKGYSGEEIAQVLRRLQAGLIDKAEVALVAEAYEEFAQYLED